MVRKEREKQQKTGQIEEEPPEEGKKWWSKLHHVLTKELSSDSFERLIERLLRESGFVQVEVAGRTGDGGIDGKGIIRVGRLPDIQISYLTYRDTLCVFLSYFSSRKSRGPTVR